MSTVRTGICDGTRPRVGMRRQAHASLAHSVGTSTTVAAFLAVLLVAGCTNKDESAASGSSPSADGSTPVAMQGGSLFNLAHLDHLGEDVGPNVRIIHIYANAPSYEWIGDDDEGVACVDDAARAAVVYLRHFELTGDRDSLRKGKALVRFVMYMQKEDGLFYNFVFDNALTINTEHQNSKADEFGWWAARGVWALGTAARILKSEDPSFATAAADRVRRTFPYLQEFLRHYGGVASVSGREYPTWLIGSYGSDATSELLLGLNAFNDAYPDAEVTEMITGFADGIEQMQFGSMTEFPYGAHASYANEWHGWGNAQTQALSEAGRLESARREATQFYPRLLVEGWRHSMVLDDSTGGREFEQIAYAVRGVAVGLLRLYRATGEAQYAKMAGIAASWFTGTNVAGLPMYDPATGRGFDGINSPEVINRNSGAESTIEALLTILEIEQIPEAKRWIFNTTGDALRVTRNQTDYHYRVYSSGAPENAHRLGIVMNLTKEELQLLEGDALVPFLHH